MKTARLITYKMQHTEGNFVTAIMYRGKTLKDFIGPDSNALIKKALLWAHNQGFTHYQLGEDTLKRNTIIPTTK